jgi:Ca2+-binding RTX toxin-like protein
MGPTLRVIGDNTGNFITLDHLVEGEQGITTVKDETRPDPPVPFDDSLFTSIAIDSGRGQDRVQLRATVRPVRVQGQDGLDMVMVGDQNGVQDIQAPLFIFNQDGQTQLFVNDSADFIGRTVTVGDTASDQDIDGLAPAPIHYAPNQLALLVINASQGDDTFVLNNTPGSPNLPTPTWIFLNGGNDSLTANMVMGMVLIDGGTGMNTLCAAGNNVTWTITGHDQGTLQSDAYCAPPIHFMDICQLNGSVTGNDTFVFQGDCMDVSISCGIDGRGGINTLDYSQWTCSSCDTMGVIVLLPSGRATGVAGGAANGIANIRNVIGSACADILVGDSQDNVLQGMGGNDLLIGGGGADTLDGGTGDNILIAGTTDYDDSVATLSAILMLWTTSDSYVDRVSSVRAYLQGGVTVHHDDSSVCTLTGGPGMDWFWARTTGPTPDIITDLRPGELIN